MSDPFDPVLSSFLDPGEHAQRAANEHLVPRGQRRCPICTETMVNQSEADIAYDVCPEHGRWVDSSEWDRLVASRRPAPKRAVAVAPTGQGKVGSEASDGDFSPSDFEMGGFD